MIWATGTLGNVVTLIVLNGRRYGSGTATIALSALALADIGMPTPNENFLRILKTYVYYCHQLVLLCKLMFTYSDSIALLLINMT